jgi:hypothetical protein
MSDLLFCLLHYYPIARENLRQFVTNLRTAKNWILPKPPAFTVLCAFFPVRTKNLKNKLRGLPEKPEITGHSIPNPVWCATPSPYGRECPCRGQLSPVEGDVRACSHSNNPQSGGHL